MNNGGKIFAGVMIAALLLIGIDFYIRHEAALRQARQEAAVKAEQEKKRAAINKKYEDALNGFIQTMGQNAEAYKKQRALMDDLVKPENLKDPKYVVENYRMMMSLIPQLTKRADSFMEIFQRADNQMQNLLIGSPPEERKTVEAAWKNLKDKQSKLYLAYFAAEQDILKAYENLMEFYVSKRGSFSYQEGDDSGLRFKDKIDKAREGEYLNAIAGLNAQQAQIIAQPAAR